MECSYDNYDCDSNDDDDSDYTMTIVMIVIMNDISNEKIERRMSRQRNLMTKKEVAKGEPFKKQKSGTKQIL